MKRLAVISAVVEVVGITAIGVGVGIELAMGAHIGFVLFGIGSGLIAGGSLLWIKVFRRR